MDRMRALAGAALVGMAAAAGCAGGSGSNNPVPHPSSAPTSTKFVISVPLASQSSAARKPNFDAPGGTQSVSISLTSVNGTKQTGTPTVANLSASATGCTQGSTSLSCTVTVNALPGTDLYTVTSYSQPNAQGSSLGTGTASVTAVAGQTATAPVTLTGTIASITLSLGTPPIAGVAATIPLVVIAKDSSGATIMGTYSSPIALSDSDASGATKLSASSIASSSDASNVTIAYTGASLSTAPSIGATAGTVSATPLAFSANDDYTVQNGSTLTYNMTLSSSYTRGTGTPSPTMTAAGTLQATYTTGASFNGQSNLINVHQTAQAGQGGLLTGGSGSEDYYYNWMPTKSGASLFEVGYVDSYVDGYGNTQTYQEIPTGQGWEIAMVPFASGNAWDRNPGYTGTSTSPTYDGQGNVTGTSTEKFVQNADGSYTGNDSEKSTDGSQSYSDVYTANPDGSAIETEEQIDPMEQWTEVYTIGTPEPAPTGTPGMVIKYTDTYTQASPAPDATATPDVTYGANWYPGGTVPQPLATDSVKDLGSGPLPTQCNVDASIATSGEHIQEKYFSTDPWGYTDAESYDYYYTPGVGLVCGMDEQVETNYDSSTGAVQSTNDWTVVQSLTASSLKLALRRAGSMGTAASYASAGLQTTLSQMHRERMQILRVRHIQARTKRMRQLRGIR